MRETVRYQRRVGGAVTEHTTLEEAMKEPFDKISFPIPLTETNLASRLILWSDGTWLLRTSQGEWKNGVFKSWEQLVADEIYDKE